LAEASSTFAEKQREMEEIRTQIPGYEKGAVQYIAAANEEDALYLGAQMVTDLLDKWYANVAFFSLTLRGEALQALVNDDKGFPCLYAVNQKNPDLGVVSRKAIGMISRKFVRATIIEGFRGDISRYQRDLEFLASSTNTPVIVIVLN
jgi:hypothetical protein